VTIDDPHDEIAVINQRIDDLIAHQQRRAIWYRNPSLITSAAAIFISVVTTAMSWYRTYQQDVTSMRAQLASTLQQASSLQIQAIDFYAKYKDDQPAYMRAATVLNAQNLILAKQAYALATALGTAASSGNLTNVANSLMQSSDVTLAENLAQQAAARADNSIDYVAANRLLGALNFYKGQKKEGEASFNKALDVFKIYPNEAKSQDFVNYQHAYTHLYWAQAAVASDCQTAKQQLALASQYMVRLSPLARQQLGSTEAEVNRMNQMTAACN
jgi:hypothetical protein